MPVFNSDSVRDNPAEAKVLRATANGNPAVFAETEPRTIRAAFLRHLLLRLPAGPDGAPWPIALTGLRIRGAIIAGALDLAFAAGPEGEALPVVVLEECDIADRIDLAGSRIALLAILRCRITHLNVSHARIDGPFYFEGTKPIRDQHIAWINGNGLTVEGGVFGQGALLAAPLPASDQQRDHALSLQGATIGGNLVLRGVRSDGAIWLLGAVIKGTLDCIGAKLNHPKAMALVAENANIGGSVHLRYGFTATGTISLRGARIMGDLDCQDASFLNPRDQALIAESAEVAGNVLLHDGFIAEGRIVFLGAQIGGLFECRSAIMRNPDGTALNTHNASIGGSLHITGGTTMLGCVFLVGARITGECKIIGATFCNPAGNAIDATSLEVGDDLTLRNVKALGDLTFRRARIGAAFVWDDLRFQHAAAVAESVVRYDAARTVVFDLSHIDIAGALHVLPLYTAVKLHINLRAASAGTLDDDVPGVWGRDRIFNGTTVDLDGFTYSRISLEDHEVEDGRDHIDNCLLWLNQQPFFRPQPYRQLAKILRLQGHPEEARRITVAENDGMPITGNLTFKLLWRFWGFFFGYGLSHRRALVTLGVFIAAGTLGTHYLYNIAQVMALSTDNVAAFSRPGDIGKEPVFLTLPTRSGDIELPCGNQINSLIYALDVMVPIVPLNQVNKCDISTEPALHPGQPLETYRFAKAIFSIIGKIITTLALITLSGILRPRDQE